ncbi:MAG: LamG domain-containing protein [Prevotella sp.]|nr:LamG domain-containing protein [Prevotella sp.]
MRKIFTFFALACMALSAQAQGKYALEAGSGAIAAGTQVTSVANITLTIGVAGEAEYADPTADTNLEGYTAYTKGNGVSGKADGSAGTVYILAPAKDGEVTVGVVLNKNKEFYVLEDGTALADYNGITVTDKAYIAYKFSVKGGKTYRVTCAGSKLGFYGFEYTVSETPGGDDPVVPSSSANYSAIADGKLAAEFAAVAGESGGVANNTEDGKSIVTIKAGKATVTAVGGTTPANDETIGGGAQQIVPGAAVEGKENTYEVASVGAWNDVSWGMKSQGDIDFWYLTGTGNPYVKMLCVQNSKDGELVEGSYKADYVYYEPDGSVGMPVTGLYYKFTASAQGAFKVKVWANKGNRKTFVVNANTMKAERLYASGYINGVVDASGKKRLLTVEQVDSVHNIFAGEKYTGALKAYQEDPEKNENPGDSATYVKSWQYVIGNGNQNFWGWLTFDVEPGEEYWVFQHSSQIGFGGFEFHEGVTAEELIKGVEAAYVYTTNFSTYEDEETGERVSWKGEKAVGNGQFTTSEDDGAIFGDYFKNDGSAAHTSYCLLPEDVLAHSANTKALTLAVWVCADAAATSESYAAAPMFAAYQEAGSTAAPMFAALYDGSLKLDNSTKCDYAGGKTYSGASDWLADKKWHYYTAVFKGESAQVYFDGELKNEWDCAGSQAGLFSNGAALKYVCLGGNAPTDANDAPFSFARLLIKNSSMTQGEIKAQMLVDFPDYEAYHSSTGIQVIRSTVKSGDAYNLSGQKVGPSYKGLVIQNGVKRIQK